MLVCLCDLFLIWQLQYNKPRNKYCFDSGSPAYKPENTVENSTLCVDMSYGHAFIDAHFTIDSGVTICRIEFVL